MIQHDDPKKAIVDYHQGFSTNSPQIVLSALGQHFIMVNGNYSAEPTNWQAHMFLAGTELEAWPELFLQEAGPYQNQYDFLHVDIRGNAAIVVTKESGHNRFRTWEDEFITWSLGRLASGWKIVGMFIRDIRNPE